jgi:23S rRNA U2552 (ribose-2'-O)-methylase RlmE/FtsJ
MLMEAREAFKKSTQYTDSAIMVAQRVLHDYYLVPYMHAGAAHNRLFFTMLEIIHEFPYLQEILQSPHVRTLHLEMGPGGFVDAVMHKMPTVDWHATSSTEVYDHIRTAKKINGHSRLLHDNVAQEVSDSMLITIQGGNLETDFSTAMDVLHPDGALVIVCDDPYSNLIATIMGMFEYVYMCKPVTIAPSSPEFVLVAFRRQSKTPILDAWYSARAELSRSEIAGLRKCMQLATYLTQIDIKSSADTQKFYLDHVAGHPGRMEKAQRVLSSIL